MRRSAGSPRLREAIAAASSGSLGWAVDPDQVVVYPGAQAALYALAQCLFDPGDEVITPEPTYVTYRGGARRDGRDHAAGAAAPRAATSISIPTTWPAPSRRGPAAVMLNFPHNPTGAT